jgi:hypothetical protein
MIKYILQFFNIITKYFLYYIYSAINIYIHITLHMYVYILY